VRLSLAPDLDTAAAAQIGASLFNGVALIDGSGNATDRGALVIVVDMCGSVYGTARYYLDPHAAVFTDVVNDNDNLLTTLQCSG
jgi:hypothetical protein